MLSHMHYGNTLAEVKKTSVIGVIEGQRIAFVTMETTKF